MCFSGDARCTSFRENESKRVIIEGCVCVTLIANSRLYTLFEKTCIRVTLTDTNNFHSKNLHRGGDSIVFNANCVSAGLFFNPNTASERKKKKQEIKVCTSVNTISIFTIICEGVCYDKSFVKCGIVLYATHKTAGYIYKHFKRKLYYVGDVECCNKIHIRRRAGYTPRLAAQVCTCEVKNFILHSTGCAPP